MKVTVFTSILCAICMPITASRVYGDFLGRYPIQGTVRPTSPYSSPTLSSDFRIPPSPPRFIPDSSASSQRVQPNYELEELRRRLEAINSGFTLLFPQLASAPQRATREPIRPSLPRSRFSIPLSAQSPLSSRTPSLTSTAPPPSFAYPRPTPAASNGPNSPPSSYWTPVRCNCGICARRRAMSPSNSNADPVPAVISTDSTIDPPAISNEPNRSTASPSVGPDQSSNRSTNPDPLPDVSKDGEKESSKDEMDNSKKTNQTPQLPESSDKSPNESQSDEEWEGPKTPEEDQPERYTVEENMKFVRAFSNSMTKLGKYKVAQTIYYLLTKKGGELDSADRAAIDYVVNERMKKDDEIIKALEQYKERHKGENESKPPLTSNEPISNQDIPMPSFMPDMLSSSHYSSEFQNPSQAESGRNFTSNNRRMPPFIRQQPSPLGSLFRFLNPSQTESEDDTNPFRNYGRTFDMNGPSSMRWQYPSRSTFPSQIQFPRASPSSAPRRWNAGSLQL